VCRQLREEWLSLGLGWESGILAIVAPPGESPVSVRAGSRAVNCRKLGRVVVKSRGGCGLIVAAARCRDDSLDSEVSKPG
jgi:hypothetical protein